MANTSEKDKIADPENKTREQASVGPAKTSARAISSQEASSPLEKLRTHSKEGQSVPEPSLTQKSLDSKTSSIQTNLADPTTSSATSTQIQSPEESKNKSSKNHQPAIETSFSSARTNQKDESASLPDAERAKTASEKPRGIQKKLFTEKSPDTSVTKIQKGIESGSMSALYDEETQKKTKLKSNESTDVALFDDHIWKFRMLKKRQAVTDSSVTVDETQKLSLAPQQKLSLEEKRSLVDRILRFIVEFFTRKSQ